MIKSVQSIVSWTPRSLVFGMVLVLAPAISAQLEVNSTLTPDEYVNDVLLGSGVEATNVQFTGSPVQIGQITGFDTDDFPIAAGLILSCLLYTSPSPRDATLSRMPSSA